MIPAPNTPPEYLVPPKLVPDAKDGESAPELLPSLEPELLPLGCNIEFEQLPQLPRDLRHLFRRARCLRDSLSVGHSDGPLLSHMSPYRSWESLA